MENNFLLSDDMLWDYADGFLEDAEKLQVEAYLQQHPEQRYCLDSILREKRAFAALPLEKPQSGFADRVMAAWVAEQTQARAVAPAKPRDWVLLSIAGVFGLFLFGAFILVIAMALESVPMVSIPEAYMPQVPVLDWAAILINPAFRYSLILLLAFLILQILDKYLQQRNRSYGLLSGH